MNKVYYDDKCVVCHSGINYLKKKHPKSNIEFFEISRLDDPVPYSKAIIGEFETNKYKGFDTIIILLRKLGYKKVRYQKIRFFHIFGPGCLNWLFSI